MATGNRTFTRNLKSVAADVATLLRSTPTAIANALNVTGSASDGKAAFARMANRIQRRIESEVPNLNVTTATLSVSANANSAAIPATLYGAQVTEITLLDTSSIINKLPIKFLGKLDARTIPVIWQNGQVVVPVPMFAYLDATEQNILFAPWLSQAATFTITFQTTPTAFTSADFDNASSTTYSVVPDDYDDILPLFLAIEVARAMGRFDLAEQYTMDLHGRSKGGVGIGRYEEFRHNFMNIPALMSRASWTNSNIPNPAGCDDPLAGVYLGSLPGYSN